MIDTPHVLASIGAGQDLHALRAGRAGQAPMKRQGTGWGVAEAALLLASDAAAFITGAELPVDGGMSALLGAAR
jgi:NAD(P)-dependent dehydrogenase (short-subunit alcohol dehydrogenase family)